jgi:hypothetical protein
MSKGKKSKLLSGAKIGLGMTAWGTSVMAIFIPFLSDYGIWMALLLAAVHGMLGGILLPMLTILTSLVNIFLLSPVSSMSLTSIFITSLLMLASGFSVKHALKSRLLGD